MIAGEGRTLVVVWDHSATERSDSSADYVTSADSLDGGNDGTTIQKVNVQGFALAKDRGTASDVAVALFSLVEVWRLATSLIG